MRLNVNPTRMELLQLKRRLKTAERGHKLLKEKRDGLMKEFMAIIRKAKQLREKLEDKLAFGFRKFLFASADQRPEVTDEALSFPNKQIELEAEFKNIMSVEIPQFKFKEQGDFLCYGLATTSGDLDDAVKSFSECLPDMVKLAEIEHSAALLTREIEKTRRRVNALEHVWVPNMKETIKYIQSKLSEQERATITALMRVKDAITA